MEVVVAENRQFSSTLCADDCAERLSKPSDAALCGISVHQSQRILSTDVGVVEKHDSYVADTQEHSKTLVTCEHTVAGESMSSVGSEEVISFTSPAESYVVADVTDECMAKDSQPACTNDCVLSVSAKLAESDIAEADPSPQCISRPRSLYSGKKSVCFPADDADGSADQPADDGDCISKLESKRMSLLLRLFESKLFDMAIALPYLFNSKEPGVLAYLGQ